MDRPFENVLNCRSIKIGLACFLPEIILAFPVLTLSVYSALSSVDVIIIIIIYCNWVVTWWQWLFYMCTKYEIGYC